MLLFDSARRKIMISSLLETVAAIQAWWRQSSITSGVSELCGPMEVSYKCYWRKPANNEQMHLLTLYSNEGSQQVFWLCGPSMAGGISKYLSTLPYAVSPMFATDLLGTSKRKPARSLPRSSIRSKRHLPVSNYCSSQRVPQSWGIVIASWI